MALETGIDAAEAWAKIRKAASALKQRNATAHTYLANNTVTMEYVIFDVYRSTRDIKITLVDSAATTGLNAYVQSLRGDSYDAVAAVAAVVSAIDDALTWIDNNAAGLNLTGDTAANAIANLSVSTNRFTPAQTSGLRARLVAINDTID